MKQIYQIVFKNRVTNKIALLNFNNYLSYENALNDLEECKYLNLLTTNIYFE